VVGIGDVDDDRADRSSTGRAAAGVVESRRGAQGVAVLRAAYARVNVPAALGQAERDGPADAAAGSGDERRAAQDFGRQTCMMSRIEMMPSTSPLETTTRWRNPPRAIASAASSRPQSPSANVARAVR
jgi:hypothetical protein